MDDHLLFSDSADAHEHESSITTLTSKEDSEKLDMVIRQYSNLREIRIAAPEKIPSFIAELLNVGWLKQNTAGTYFCMKGLKQIIIFAFCHEAAIGGPFIRETFFQKNGKAYTDKTIERTLQDSRQEYEADPATTRRLFDRMTNKIRIKPE